MPGFHVERVLMSLKFPRMTMWAPLVAALGLTLAAPQALAAGDAKRGAKLAYTCYGCHGIPDYRNAYPTYHVPKIFGQNAEYLAAALAEYKNGNRPHPTMKGQAGSLSDADIADLSAFFAGPTPIKGDGPTGTAPAAAATCAACHGPDGVAIMAMYPVLAGQHKDYLEQSLRAYRSGKRVNAIMQGMSAQLTDADIKALAAWFAAQKPGVWTQKANGQKFE